MKYIKQYAPKFKGNPWPVGCMVVFTEKGKEHWKPSLHCYYIANWETRYDGSYIYSVRGCTCDGEVTEGFGIAWVEHDELKPWEY